MQERELLSTQPQLPTVAMTLWHKDARVGQIYLVQVQIQMHKDGQINLILFEEHFLRLCRYASFGIHKDKEKHIKISKCGSHLVLEHIIANEMKRKTVSSLLTRQ